MIQLKEVRKAYSSSVDIGPVTLDIPEGGITALVGPNGAGKSTLLTMIGRLLDLDSGHIEVAGMDVTSARSKDLAKVVSILRQENHFVTRLTVRQLVGFGRFPYTQGRLNAEDEEIISKYIDFLGLRGLEGRYLDQLSGGQRQRVWLALALAQDTPVLLLDEPTTFLDPAHAMRMLELARAQAQAGKTVVVVLHDLMLAGHYSDSMVVMKSGDIIARGAPKQALSPKVLAQAYGIEAEAWDDPDSDAPIIVPRRVVAAH